MSNSFSSLEDIATLINNLINSNKDASPLKHINKLVNDFTNLLIESDFYDVKIKVGVDQDVKTFKAHSNILKARSSYFKTAFSNNWVKRSEDGIILFEKDNMSPKVFEVLLTYIYNGIINIEDLDPYEIIELLEACDELDFNELIDDLQDYLILESKEWIQHDLNYLYQISSRHQSSFKLLQNYFKEITNEEPELFLKSEDLKEIDKSIFISLLEKDNLKLDEIDIWNCSIQWGIRQIENLEEKNISEWNLNDFKELRNLLKDIIPLVRFQDISNEDFDHKIKPYQKLFPEFFWDDLSHYYLIHAKKPTLILLPSRNPKLDSILINQKHTLLFASWIDRKNPPYNLPNEVKYKFKLIYRRSRDGLKAATFHQKCDDISRTLVVGKRKFSDQILGGYNPLHWNGNGIFKSSTESFIFNISNKNDINTARFSYVVKNDYDHAIWCSPTCLPYFGSGSDIWFSEDGSISSYPNTYNNLNIFNRSKKGRLDELEVFQVINKN